MILDLTGKTVDEIADILNNTANSVQKLTKQQTADLLLDETLFPKLSDPVIAEFKKKLESIGDELTSLLDPISLVNQLGNSTLKELLDIQKYISADGALSALKSIPLSNFSQVTTQLAEITGAPQINELLGNLTTVDKSAQAVMNSLIDGTAIMQLKTPGIVAPGQFITQASNAFVSSFYDGLQKVVQEFANSSPILKEFSNLVDAGFGHNDNASGKLGDGNYRANNPGHSVDIPEDTPGEIYTSLSAVIQQAQGQNWTATNSSPGNPLIIEAYGLSGRSYDKDGTTGTYNWNAPFITWVLNKAKIESTQNLSAKSYANYGQSVHFTSLENIRKYDIAVFDSAAPVSVVGFVIGADASKNTLTILAGNIQGKLAEKEIPLGRNTRGALRLVAVRRNWYIPPESNVPLFKPSATSWFTGAR